MKSENKVKRNVFALFSIFIFLFFVGSVSAIGFNDLNTQYQVCPASNFVSALTLNSDGIYSLTCSVPVSNVSNFSLSVLQTYLSNGTNLNKTYADTLYYGLSNPYSFYNSTSLGGNPYFSNNTFYTNLSGGGKLGIGTTTPNQSLSVNGNISVNSGNYVGSGLGYDCSGCASYSTIQVYNPTNGHMVLQTHYSGGNIDLLPASGNVGIGTTASSYGLQIVSPTSGEPTSLLVGSGTANTAGNQLRIGNSSYGDSLGSRYSGADAFYASNAYQNIYNNDSWAKPSSAYSSNILLLGTSSNGAGTAFQILNSPVNTSTGSKTNFFTGTLLTLTESGNLGVGTASPLSKFVVSSSSGSGIEISSGSGTSRSSILAYNRTASAYETLDLNANNLWFRPNATNSNNFIVSGTGAVGVNVSNPPTLQQTLNVIGTLNISNGTTNSVSLFSNNLGNVGIGTSSPGTTLSFAPDSTVSVATSNGADNGNLNIVGGGALDSARGATITLNGVNQTTNPGDLRLTAANSAGAVRLVTAGNERLTILNSGNVGIGTTSPQNKLNVVGTENVTSIGASTQALSVTNGSNNIFFVPNLGSASYNGISSVGDMGLFFTNGSNANTGSQGLVIAPWAAATSGIKITQSGNVGINTTTPKYSLDIKAGQQDGVNINGTSLSSRVGILIDAAPNQQAQILFNNGSTPKWQIGKQADDSFFLWDSANAKNVMTVNLAGVTTLGENAPLTLLTNGNVGINTTSPQNTLNVVGAANVTGAFYPGVFSGNVCSSADYSIGRNTTGLYYCNQTAGAMWK